jgi:hypothetical protein
MIEMLKLMCVDALLLLCDAINKWIQRREQRQQAFTITVTENTEGKARELVKTGEPPYPP